MTKRIEKFGLASDGLTILIVHPSTTRLDGTGHVGTVVAKLEPWVGPEDAAAIVFALNAGAIRAIEKRGTRNLNPEPSLRDAYIEAAVFNSLVADPKADYWLPVPGDGERRSEDLRELIPLWRSFTPQMRYQVVDDLSDAPDERLIHIDAANCAIDILETLAPSEEPTDPNDPDGVA